MCACMSVYMWLQEVLASVKLIWKSLQGPISSIGVLEGAPLHFHVNLREWKRKLFSKLVSGVRKKGDGAL